MTSNARVRPQRWKSSWFWCENTCIAIRQWKNASAKKLKSTFRPELLNRIGKYSSFHKWRNYRSTESVTFHSVMTKRLGKTRLAELNINWSYQLQELSTNRRRRDSTQTRARQFVAIQKSRRPLVKHFSVEKSLQLKKWQSVLKKRKVTIKETKSRSKKEAVKHKNHNGTATSMWDRVAISLFL